MAARPPVGSIRAKLASLFGMASAAPERPKDNPPETPRPATTQEDKDWDQVTLAHTKAQDLFREFKATSTKFIGTDDNREEQGEKYDAALIAYINTLLKFQTKYPNSKYKEPTL